MDMYCSNTWKMIFCLNNTSMFFCSNTHEACSSVRTHHPPPQFIAFEHASLACPPLTKHAALVQMVLEQKKRFRELKHKLMVRVIAQIMFIFLIDNMFIHSSIHIYIHIFIYIYIYIDIYFLCVNLYMFFYIVYSYVGQHHWYMSNKYLYYLWEINGHVLFE